MYFCTLCPSIGPKARSRQALDRLPPVSNFLTNFWMQHCDGERLSPNSVRNAVWLSLNEPVCQYLRTIKPRCLGPLARDSPVFVDSSLHNFHCVIPAQETYFFLLKNAQTGSGSHPASYSTHYLPGLKRPGRYVNHSRPSSAEVENEWSYTSTPHTCLQVGGQRQLYLQVYH